VKEEVIQVASPSHQFFTTIITGFTAINFAQVVFDKNHIPYLFPTNLPWDFWEKNGGYTFNFEEIYDV
jgi:hypothetical protein